MLLTEVTTHFAELDGAHVFFPKQKSNFPGKNQKSTFSGTEPEPEGRNRFSGTGTG